MIIRLIMFLCHLKYKQDGNDIFYIRGTDKHYPRYLLYTENKNTYNRMDKF